MTDEQIFEHLPDAVVVIGRDRCVRALNRAAERLTGWSRADAVGQPYGEIVRLRDAGGFLVHERDDPFEHATRLASGSPEREYMLHRHDGSQRWVSLRTAYRWSDDELAEVIATLRDSGRRHRIERSAYDLIATLAHDLRSPLTSVKGFTATLLRKWDAFSDEQKRHMLTTIDWDADRMNRLLRDLLDFSRLEAGRLELKRQEVGLAELATRVAERVQMDAKHHQITAEFPSDFPVVSADPGKVEQVIVNLVENAVKHGDPGAVRVSGTVDGSMVTVRVTDSGPGIDAAHVPYIFTKFYRRGGERHTGGTGLGLYICKGVIEAHGGDIRVESSSPTGTVFAFTLPVEDA